MAARQPVVLNWIKPSVYLPEQLQNYNRSRHALAWQSSRQTASSKDRVQGARVSRKRGVHHVRRSDCETKRNAEIGLSANHSAGRRLRPKPEFKARESRASEAYSLYAAATARRSATPKSGFRRSRHCSLKSVAGGSRNAVRTAGSAATKAVSTISGNESASVTQSTVYRKVHPNDCRLIT
jgi:hypothetical protein